MSIRCAHKNGLNDEIALKGFELIEKYSETGIIPEDEIDAELLLFFDSEKLAFPITSQKGSLSWGMRNLTVQKLEIPYIIRELFKNHCDWKKAVISYFTKIGEMRPEDFVKIVREIVKLRKKFLISGDDIVKISRKFNRDGGVVIAELKGAGIISPYSGCGRAISKYEKIMGSPIYEINRFLIKLVEGDETT